MILPRPPPTTSTVSLSFDFEGFFPASTCKWHRAVFVFVWLTSFRSICGVTKGRASSFLVAEYRPIFGLSGGLYAGVRYAYLRIFFKHVSVGGHLGGSPVWLL